MESEIRSLRYELENRNASGAQQQHQQAHLLKNVNDLEALQVLELKQLFNQLKIDVDKVEKVSGFDFFGRCPIIRFKLLL